MDEAILVIGNHDVVRGALRKRLEIAFPRYQVIEAASIEEAVAMVLSKSPRVVIVDIGPPAMERLEVAWRIKTVQLSAQIVVWTIHDWENYRADAVVAGATVYVLKEETQDELVSVLTAMLSAQLDSHQCQTDEVRRKRNHKGLIRKLFTLG